MQYHIYINLIVWGVLIDIPIVIVRYFKLNPHYIKVHGIFMTGIIFASFFAEGAMSYTESEMYSIDVFKTATSKEKIHMVFGVSIFCLIFIQLTAGWLLYFFIKGESIVNSIRTLKCLHKFAGNAIYFIAKSNILIGAYMSWNGYFNPQDITLYCLYLFTFVWRVFLEFAFHKR